MATSGSARMVTCEPGLADRLPAPQQQEIAVPPQRRAGWRGHKADTSRGGGVVTTMVRLRRVYEEPSPEDGIRVLVDRLWPRGLTKEKAALDEWVKDVAPSTELRRWYGHDPAQFDEFRRRYEQELAGPEQAEALAGLRETARRDPHPAHRDQGHRPQRGGRAGRPLRRRACGGARRRARAGG